LQNYSRFLSTRKDFDASFISYSAKLGTNFAVVGLLISAVLFVLWMLQIKYLFHPVSIATIIGVLVLLAMAKTNRNSYYTTLVLVVVALLISTMRELIRFDIMSALGYSIYDYPMNLEIPSIVMFLSTFLIMGFVGVAYLLTMAWKVGKREGVFDGSKDVVVTKLGQATLYIMIAWMAIYFAWGIATLFKNIL